MNLRTRLVVTDAEEWAGDGGVILKLEYFYNESL